MFLNILIFRVYVGGKVRKFKKKGFNVELLVK